MAELFATKNIQLDLIFSSSTIRARETTNSFISILNFRNEIIFSNKLYLASSDTILKEIYSLDEVYKNVLIVCHNPGITEVVNFLGNYFINNIPTAGMSGFVFNDFWKKLNNNNCKLLFFDYPKKIKSG